jgi:ABC-type polysaccharide/polyol phosphate export permease
MEIIWCLGAMLYLAIGVYTVFASREVLSQNSISFWGENRPGNNLNNQRVTVIYPLSAIIRKKFENFSGDGATFNLVGLFFWPIRIIVMPILVVALYLLVGWCSFFLSFVIHFYAKSRNLIAN